MVSAYQLQDRRAFVIVTGLMILLAEAYDGAKAVREMGAKAMLLAEISRR